MLRYRLRTLMIVLALCGAIFARIGYIKRMAEFHRREATAGFSRLAREFGESPEQIVPMQVQAVRDCEGDPSTWQLIRESPSYYYVSACYHQILADRYERAIYRPWQIVSQTE
jgi:hypothetical protein